MESSLRKLLVYIYSRLRASASSSAFQTFHQILVKFLELSPTSSSPTFHQTTVCQNHSPYLTPKISTLLYFLDLCHFPPHQAVNKRKQATDFPSTRPTRAGYKVGFGRTRTRSSSTPTTQLTRTDADNSTDEDRRRQCNR
jgi:hypothetical protein